MSNLSERADLLITDLFGFASDERRRSGRVIRRSLALLAIIVALAAIAISIGKH